MTVQNPLYDGQPQASSWIFIYPMVARERNENLLWIIRYLETATVVAADFFMRCPPPAFNGPEYFVVRIKLVFGFPFGLSFTEIIL